MPFFFNKPNIDPLLLSTPLMVIDAETGIVPGTDNADITSIVNQVNAGGTDTSWVGAYRTGCNVVGLEEPTWSTGYDHPLHSQGLVDYLATKNVGVVRIMVCWESLQSTSMGTISGAYYTKLKTLVDRFLVKGIYVLIAPWQYNNTIGDTDMCYYGGAFTSAQFSDFWGKMATLFSYDERIAFGLINEPHVSSGGGMVGITLNNWFLYAQNAVNAIRGAGSSNYIVVPGMGYASAGSWVSNGSAAKFIAMTDTFTPKRLIAECHNYGATFASAANDLASENSAMAAHARTNGYKVFVGECAQSANPTTNPASANDIAQWANWVTFNTSTYSDVMLGWTWFGCDDNTQAGWGTDFFHWSLVNPGTNNVDSQFMNLIENTLVRSAGGGGSGAPLVANVAGARPQFKPSDFDGASKHSLSFTQASAQKFYFSNAVTLSAGASHFATFKHTATDAVAAQTNNAPMTLFGYNSAPQIWSAGFSAGTARYVYGSSTSSSVPTNAIAFSKNVTFTDNSGSSDYYVFVPTAYDSTHATPTSLLIWLHGSGGSGYDDITYHLASSGNNYITMAVGGFEGGSWNSDMNTGMAYVLAALSHIKTRFNINPVKVIIGGYSAGGDLAYKTIWHNSALFSGIIACNTDPFRDTGETQSALLAANASGWKFNIRHLLHTSDGTYLRAAVLTSLNACSSAGYSPTSIELPGTHYDEPGVYGDMIHDTYADIINSLLIQMSSGTWSAPGSGGAGTVSYDSAATNLNDGNPHTVCWTHAADGSLKVYVDGTLNNTWSAVTYNAGALLNIIGAGYLDTDAYNGSVAEAMSYNGVLTDQQVRDLHSRATQKWF